ncbi:MAG: sigma-70 family RNA polymerase sigma factor [Kiritimatiellae bacterium]|nr:sigma-70 family RNA polymerase sigma factor [Kiritimatiellia bacterium]
MTGKELIPDEALVEALRSRRVEAWSVFYERFEPVVRFVVSWRKWAFTPEAQEDVAQATWADLINGMERFRGDCPLEEFVKKVCVLRSIDEIRRTIASRERVRPLAYRNEDGEWVDEDVPAPDAVDPLEEITRLEKVHVLREKLSALSEGCQTIVACFYDRGMSYKEIAKEFGIAVNTVGSRLAKCLKKLKGMLTKHPVFKESMSGD